MAALDIGAVALIHRFSSSLTALVRFHACVVDGVLKEVERLHWTTLEQPLVADRFQPEAGTRFWPPILCFRGKIRSFYLFEGMGSFSQLQRMASHLMLRIPVGRLGRAVEIAKAVVFFASDESLFTVGSELVIDGGMSNI